MKFFFFGLKKFIRRQISRHREENFGYQTKVKISTKERTEDGKGAIFAGVRKTALRSMAMCMGKATETAGKSGFLLSRASPGKRQAAL